MKFLVKIILILLLLYAALVIEYTSCGLFEKETHLIPYGYIGKVGVHYNIPTGEPEHISEGRRIYKIPQNGILHTRAAINQGKMFDKDVIRFYYVNDKDSIVQQLDYNYVADTQFYNVDTNQVKVLYWALTGTGYSDSLKCETRTFRYVIDTVKHFLKYKYF